MTLKDSSEGSPCWWAGFQAVYWSSTSSGPRDVWKNGTDINLWTVANRTADGKRTGLGDQWQGSLRKRCVQISQRSRVWWYLNIYAEVLNNLVDKRTPEEVRQPLPQCLFSEPLYKMDMAGGSNNVATHGSNLTDFLFAGLICLSSLLRTHLPNTRDECWAVDGGKPASHLVAEWLH